MVDVKLRSGPRPGGTGMPMAAATARSNIFFLVKLERAHRTIKRQVTKRADVDAGSGGPISEMDRGKRNCRFSIREDDRKSFPQSPEAIASGCTFKATSR